MFENPINIDSDELTMLSIIIGGALISDHLHCSQAVIRSYVRTNVS